jgi:hypothetical protein
MEPSTPTQINPSQIKSSPKAGSNLPLILAAVGIVLALAGSVGVYSFSSSKIKTLDTQVSDLKSAAAKQQNDLKGTIDSKTLQAVFLASGQVYFGNLTLVNNQHSKLTNVYYLQTSSPNTGKNMTQLEQNLSGSGSGASLVKLGCEVHKPQDQMTLTNSQITFWENMKPDGQVSKAIAAYEKQNPNGQQCS